MLLIYFISGLARWATGLAALLESARLNSPIPSRSSRCLSACGIVHGSHEWLEVYVLGLRQRLRKPPARGRPI
jgi:hypothetical protein